MTTKRVRAPDSDGDAELRELFSAIAERDVPKASRILAESPVLARYAAEVGASRQDASTYYFPQIAHYVYAGDTPLHLAGAAYATDVAHDLVSRGANVRARNRLGAEPLHYAADGIPGSISWNPDAQQAIIQFLIKVGADPNARDKTGVAPLHRAVRTRSTPAVRALLIGGADFRMRNKSGSTPLHLAVLDTGRGGTAASVARQEQTTIIRLLVAQGARPSDKDSAGKSVISCAKSEWIRALFRDA
jgi:ankyrin repeat protein